MLDLILSCAREFGSQSFNGNLMYKLKKIVGCNIFSAQFIKIISHYKKIGYATDCMIGSQPNQGWLFAFLFNCMRAGRSSDSMTVPPP